MMREGSQSFEGSKASVRIPSPSLAKMRFLEFSLLPMIKYAMTASLPFFVLPSTIPLPGYALPSSSENIDVFFTFILLIVWFVLYSFLNAESGLSLIALNEGKSPASMEIMTAKKIATGGIQIGILAIRLPAS